jgi:hypothetical protein
MSRRHYCDYSGHDWQGSENCKCIYGVPAQGHDHSDCPVELRACPEHAPKQQRSMTETMTYEPDAAFVQKWPERPHCECGYAEADPSEFVGWCRH